MNEKHDSIKKKIKVIGFVLLSIGIICVIVGAINIALTIINDNGIPKLFFLCFIGFSCIGFGGALVVIGFSREINKYMKDENIPVTKETYQDLKPEINDLASTMQNKIGISCYKCGFVNESNSSFCKKCGTSLVKKICPHCGKQIDPDSIYCSKCGKKVEE